jgi:BirA family biotin operon repressor/biotin-[acetyl-CoA-carboxylase] ligase
MIGALAVADALDGLALCGVVLKWPNDVLIADRKVAGILAQVHAAHLILGFGVNVNAEVPPELNRATSVARELKRAVDLNQILTTIVVQFDSYYDALLNGRRFTQPWARRLITVGREVDVIIAARTVHGVAVGVADDGALLVRRADGILESFHAADVTLQMDPRPASLQEGVTRDAEVEVGP